MTIEVRRKKFQFSGLKDILPEEFGEGGEQESLFLQDAENQVGELTANSLAQQVQHMMVAMEDVNKHAKLMVDLVAHISATRG